MRFAIQRLASLGSSKPNLYSVAGTRTALAHPPSAMAHPPASVLKAPARGLGISYLSSLQYHILSSADLAKLQSALQSADAIRDSKSSTHADLASLRSRYRENDRAYDIERNSKGFRDLYDAVTWFEDLKSPDELNLFLKGVYNIKQIWLKRDGWSLVIIFFKFSLYKNVRIVDGESFNICLAAFADIGRIRPGMSIVGFMVKLGLTLHGAYTSVIAGFLGVDRVGEAVKWAETIVNCKGSRDLGQRAILASVNAFLRNDNSDGAMQMIDHFDNIGAFFHARMMRTYVKRWRDNPESFRFVSTTELEELPLNFLGEEETLDLVEGRKRYTETIRRRFREGDVIAAMTLFEKMSTPNLNPQSQKQIPFPNAYTYSIVLNGLVKNWHGKVAVELFQKIPSMYQVNPFVVSAIVQYLCRVGSTHAEMVKALQFFYRAHCPDLVLFRLMFNGLIRAKMFIEAKAMVDYLVEEPVYRVEVADAAYLKSLIDQGKFQDISGVLENMKNVKN